jgi:calcineurin-like phosphoesterase family protein
MHNTCMHTFITSDLHFSHRNSINFCPLTRGKFKDIEELNQYIISEWNQKVRKDDLTYILGDVAFCSGQDAAKLLAQCNGRKILIIGNHDRKNLKDYNFQQAFSEIHEYLEVVFNGVRVCLFHFPIMDFNQQHRGSVHLHGHLHQNLSGLEKYRVRNVGWDYTGRVVSLLDDIVADALTGEIKQHN